LERRVIAILRVRFDSNNDPGTPWSDDILKNWIAFYTPKLFRKIFKSPMITFTGLSCLSK
jgi:hypothetical protein